MQHSKLPCLQMGNDELVTNRIHVLMIESSFLDSFEEAVIVQDNSLKGKSVKVGSTLGQIESKNKSVYELKCPVEGHLEEFGDCKQVQYFCLIKTNRK